MIERFQQILYKPVKEVAFPSSQPATQPLDGSFEMDDSQSQVFEVFKYCLYLVLSNEYLLRILWRVFGASFTPTVGHFPGFQKKMYYVFHILILGCHCALMHLDLAGQSHVIM